MTRRYLRPLKRPMTVAVVGCGGTGSRLVFFRISLSSPGAILQPQPPPCDSDVSRGEGGVGCGALIEVFPAFRFGSASRYVR